MENAVTKREKISYGLYFMGQNVFYGLIGYMTTYFTDIGITAALVAIVALITKVWDAISCFHIAVAMIYSNDFCVSEFSHKKYLRFRID